MKTILSFASLFLAVSAVACAAPAEEPEEPVVAAADTTSTSTPQMISQRPCTPQELAMGAIEINGYCYSGGSGGSGGDPTSPACVARCGANSVRCESRCEARGSSEACSELCLRQESICYENCF